MIEYFKYLKRNPSELTTGIRKARATQKAMNSFRSLTENNWCRYCGTTKKIEIHHIEPVSFFPNKADDFNNMIALCHRCHFTVAHMNNYKKYIHNIAEICMYKMPIRESKT